MHNNSANESNFHEIFNCFREMRVLSARLILIFVQSRVMDKKFNKSESLAASVSAFTTRSILDCFAFSFVL